MSPTCLNCGEEVPLFQNQRFHVCKVEPVSNPLQLNEQQETITWHRYPEVKPPKDAKYLAYHSWGIRIEHYIVLDDNYARWTESIVSQEDVIAWAEMPRGWVE